MTGDVNTTMHDGDGRRFRLRVRQDSSQNVTQALNAVRLEREHLAAWQKLDQPERHMVQAVVQAALRRLLENPGWIPSSVRLGPSRLDVFFVVELDVDQVEAAQIALDLDLEVALARQVLAEFVLEMDEAAGADKAAGPNGADDG